MMIIDFLLTTGLGFSIAGAIAYYAYRPLRPKRIDSLKATITETSKLIDKAGNELKIVSDSLYPEFYNDESISRALEDGANRGLGIKILYGPRADLSKVPKLRELHEQGSIEMRRLNREPNSHFMVLDGGRHVYLEGTHSEGMRNGLKAAIIYYSVKLGWKYNDLFDELWNEAEPEQKANLII